MLCEIFKITIGLYSVVVITSDSDLKNHNFREPRFDPGYDLIFLIKCGLKIKPHYIKMHHYNYFFFFFCFFIP